jgi:hypothetical protein
VRLKHLHRRLVVSFLRTSLACSGLVEYDRTAFQRVVFAAIFVFALTMGLEGRRARGGGGGARRCSAVFGAYGEHVRPAQPRPPHSDRLCPSSARKSWCCAASTTPTRIAWFDSLRRRSRCKTAISPMR